MIPYDEMTHVSSAHLTKAGHSDYGNTLLLCAPKQPAQRM